MSIEKEGSGFPEVNVRRRTTKVNLSVIFAVILFFAVAAGAAFWFAERSGRDVPPPSPPTENR